MKKKKAKLIIGKRKGTVTRAQVRKALKQALSLQNSKVNKQ